MARERAGCVRLSAPPDPSLKLADFDYDAKTINGSAELFQKYTPKFRAYIDEVERALGNDAGWFGFGTIP
ncbi:hypothetical protein [Methyloceanibacter sp.]|uniref:hypothetical protein n=1 Tax=Methyloceanibacter sp. TaxID=1965321 RepID=UPI00351B1FDC